MIKQEIQEEETSRQFNLEKIICSYNKESENTPMVHSFRVHVPAQKQKQFELDNISEFSTEIKSLNSEKKNNSENKNEISNFKPKLKKNYHLERKNKNYWGLKMEKIDENEEKDENVKNEEHLKSAKNQESGQFKENFKNYEKTGDHSKTAKTAENAEEIHFSGHSDFDSCGEEFISDVNLDQNFDPKLILHFVKKIDSFKKKKIAKKKHIIEFAKFVKENQEEKKGTKIFPCEFCDKIFLDPRAKGGHTSTKHKGKSSKFQKRTKTKKNRGIERMRNKFFKENY